MYRYCPRVNCEGVLAWRPLKEIIPRELSLCSVSRIHGNGLNRNAYWRPKSMGFHPVSLDVSANCL